VRGASLDLYDLAALESALAGTSLRASCIFLRLLIPPIPTRWLPHAVARRMARSTLPMSSGPDAGAAIMRGTRLPARGST
jgi:hypothetical protein